jgi:polyisoprenoid-binding protein YceI
MAIQRWDIDTSHSGLHFTVRHMVISKVRGAFERWQGAFDFDPQQPSASKVTARIEAASIDTREAKRDEHLRSPEFLDAEKYPVLTFESTKVERKKADRFRVAGHLTIRGATRPVELAVEFLGTGKDPWGHERIAFQASTSINRKDFGLTWNHLLEAGGVLVGEQVDVSIGVQAIRSQPERASG